MRLLAFALLFALSACQDRDVHVYRTAKENPGDVVGLTALMEGSPEAGGPMGGAAPMASSEMPSGGEAPAAATAGLPIQWKVPKGWQTAAASGMRVASFAFSGADISVVAIPGEAGGDLANVNRWRGQLGLGPIGENEMSGVSKKLKTAAGSVLVVDLSGADPKGEIQGKARLLGAILALDDRQWFFKAMGTDEAVAKTKPSFLNFLRSLKRASNS